MFELIDSIAKSLFGEKAGVTSTPVQAEGWKSIPVSGYWIQVPVSDHSFFKLATTFWDTPDYLIRMEQDGTIKEWGQGVESLTGVPSPQAIGKNILFLYKREEPAFNLDWFSEGISRQMEVKLGTGQDSTWIGVTIYESGADLIGFVEDISDRILLEERMRTLSAVVENAHEAMLIADKQKNILFANDAFTAITGYLLEDIKGKNMLWFLPHEEQTRLHQLDSWIGEVRGINDKNEIFQALLKFSTSVNTDKEILGYWLSCSDLAKHAELALQLKELAATDPVTGLPNRNATLVVLDQTIKQVQRDQEAGALLLFDIAHFKRINNQIGYAEADKILQILGQRIKHVLRAEDFVARLGSDEFAVVVSGLKATPQFHLQKIVHKIQKALESPILSNVEGASNYVPSFVPLNLNALDQLEVSACCGVSLFDEETVVATEHLSRAEYALNKAKLKSEFSIPMFWVPHMQEEVEQKHKIESRLKAAIGTSDLFLCFQPKQQIFHGNFDGAEVLVRWQDQGQFISPAEFIPVAENSGLIVPLGNWIIEEALKSANKLEKTCGRSIPLAINISAKQLHQPDLADYLVQVCSYYAIKPENIKLELTETSFIEDFKTAETLVAQLVQAGFKISLDDFGTGYSSLTLLKKFEFSELKIDMSFVKGLPDDSPSAAIISGLATLARGLGIRSVAEGVESKEQLILLKALGVDIAQGYHIAKPLPFKEFESYLNRNK